MSRMFEALAGLFRRWRYVEEEEAGTAAPRTAAGGDTEAQRLRTAIERDERLIADYRRNGCHGLAREREASVRSMRLKLGLLEG